MDGAQVSLNEIVYIDDVQMFTKVASDLGIKSIWHQDYKTTCNALEDLGLKAK